MRGLPSVEQVLGLLNAQTAGYPRALVVATVRRILSEARGRLRSGASIVPDIARQVLGALAAIARPSLRSVINATGVVLHTNLGRAPLPRFEPIFGYSNLEYDLDLGRRGKRDSHVGPLLEALLGVPAIAVNNNAAAVYLALNELAAGYEVIVSRGELIEIGDGFRIPDIMQRSGALLREVGTTNRTSMADYRAAITDRTRLILRVHPSNFTVHGFTAKPELAELAALASETGIPLYEDLGSGCLVPLGSYGIEEPLVGGSLHAGVHLVSFSTDKLLGGPQSGILAGRPELVARLRRNPMFRALRLDKLITQALETTLRSLLLERYEGIPTLWMLSQTADAIRARAERLLPQLHKAEIVAGESVIGGGSTPQQSIPTWLIAIQADDAAALAAGLRTGEPPVVARIEDGRLLLDLRTVSPEEEAGLLRALYARSW
ncbi:MAG TPA: L-seryl-tRNA(Sec) selenium transferase [Bryobacteraceae bacterium]|nr:L-seryl-tRNA(Sec) selenium transferase [Bryobacteraceae bacterium]